MTRLPLILAVLALSGCAVTGGDTAPGCHGPRRPANPHGSVLGEAPPPPAPAPPAAAPGPATPGACP